MLVTPTSSEQRMNGLIIEENGMGYTMVKDQNDHISVGKMIYNLLNDNEYSGVAEPGIPPNRATLIPVAKARVSTTESHMKRGNFEHMCG